MDEPGAAGGAREIVFENTYITEPTGFGPKVPFRTHEVRALLRALLCERIEGQAYDPVKAAHITKHIAEDLREKVKALGCERHKLVIQVTLGQKTGQALRSVSRCLWDTTTDGFASECYENETLYCLCQVFALYYE